MKKYLSLVLTMMTVISIQSFAGGINKPFPTNPAELEGVFSGRQMVNGKDHPVDLFIHSGSMSGSFIVTLVRKSKEAQIFYAETLDDKTLGFKTLSLVNAKQWKPIDTPAALMKISVDAKNVIQSIEISPQDGVTSLEGPISLDATSKAFKISDTLAQGDYSNRSNRDAGVLKIYKSGNDNVLVSGAIPSLGISNDYSLNFDLTGVGALRSFAYADQYQRREKNEISALVLPISISNKPGVIVIKTSVEGNMTPSVIMKATN